MEEKDWWKSRTIWTALVTALVPILTALGVKEELLTPEMQAGIVTLITTVAGVMIIVFRRGTDTTIKKAGP